MTQASRKVTIYGPLEGSVHGKESLGAPEFLKDSGITVTGFLESGVREAWTEHSKVLEGM